MKLSLQELPSKHPLLRGFPNDLPRCGALALQRSGHSSPTQTEVRHDGSELTAEMEWIPQSLAFLEVIDSNRLTEDGAEAIAITYANSKDGWVLKRRLQRGESADWLMQNASGWLALEVSGMAAGDPGPRLKEKQQQVADCSLPVERLAIVVQFDQPLIMAGSA